jgi:hypothetical protein
MENLNKLKRAEEEKQKLIATIAKVVFGCSCKLGQDAAWKLIQESPKLLKGIQDASTAK